MKRNYWAPRPGSLESKVTMEMKGLYTLADVRRGVTGGALATPQALVVAEASKQIGARLFTLTLWEDGTVSHGLGPAVTTLVPSDNLVAVFTGYAEQNGYTLNTSQE